MLIKNHLLFGNDGQQVPFVPIPNKGGKYTPQYLVMHYTAVTAPNGSVSWFKDPTAKASAHLLIDREGHITQFAPFNVVTWHAGVSSWHGINGLNSCSIGIELVNGGRLVKAGDSFMCPTDHRPVASGDVIFAKHKNDTEGAFWQQYTEKQLTAAIEVARLLVNQYKLKDVIGHEDIAPHRKSDPGPAFPMTSFRSRAMGNNNEHIDLYNTSTEVNIRSGAGTAFPTIAPMPLPARIKVQVLKREGNWSFVEVLEPVHNLNDLEGWVSSKFLEKA